MSEQESEQAACMHGVKLTKECGICRELCVYGGRGE